MGGLSFILRFNRFVNFIVESNGFGPDKNRKFNIYIRSVSDPEDIKKILIKYCPLLFFQFLRFLNGRNLCCFLYHNFQTVSILSTLERKYFIRFNRSSAYQFLRQNYLYGIAE